MHPQVSHGPIQGKETFKEMNMKEDKETLRQENTNEKRVLSELLDVLRSLQIFCKKLKLC